MGNIRKMKKLVPKKHNYLFWNWSIITIVEKCVYKCRFFLISQIAENNTGTHLTNINEVKQKNSLVVVTICTLYSDTPYWVDE